MNQQLQEAHAYSVVIRIADKDAAVTLLKPQGNAGREIEICLHPWLEISIVSTDSINACHGADGAIMNIHKP